MALAPVPAHPRRLVYLGTPEMAVPPLRALVHAGFDVALAVTRPDARRGRGAELSVSPVGAAAAELGLGVVHAPEGALGTPADLGVVVAYGRIIKPPVLAVLPMINLHFSLLPRWRGAAPVERALLAGDDETGVCVMQVEEGLDTGGVFARTAVPIGPHTTAADLRAELVAAGTDLLVRTLQSGLGVPEPQVGEPTYAAKLDPAELRLDWELPAIVLDRLVRVGGAWTTVRGRRLKVVAAEPITAVVDLGPGALDGVVVGTGQGALRLVTVQPEGKAPVAAAEWRRGARLAPGEVLGA